MVRAPGACINTDWMPARPVGMTSSASRVNWVRVVVDVTSTTGAAPETVTVSASAPTLSVTSTFAMKPAVSRTSVRRIV